MRSTIESLDNEEYAELRQRSIERDWIKWDKEIEADSKAGKLNFLVKEALEEKRKGER